MLKNKKYFLFDIDGTLAVDDTLIDGSKELIEYIESIGGRSFYITNNSMKSRKDYMEKFARWDIKTDEGQFMTASYATCQYLKEHYLGKKLFIMGTPSFEEEVKSYGFEITSKVEPDITAVVVGFDRTLDYGKVEAACELLFSPEIDYIGTNPDFRCPTAFGFTPDCGGICAMLDVTVDRHPYYVGKPNADIVMMCMEQVDAKKEEVIVVGDRLYTDIACGINAGVATALVYSGEAQEADLADTEFKPDVTFTNIRKLYEAFRKSHKA